MTVSQPAATSHAFTGPVAARVDTLLREELEALGEDLSALPPEHIAEHMHCEVYPDKSMVYAWKELPILRVVPEESPDGVIWRMFTRDEYDG